MQWWPWERVLIFLVLMLRRHRWIEKGLHPKYLRSPIPSGIVSFLSLLLHQGTRKRCSPIYNKILSKIHLSFYKLLIFQKHICCRRPAIHILPSTSLRPDTLSMHPCFLSTCQTCRNQVHWEYICCILVHLWSSICKRSCTSLSIEASIHLEAIDWLIFGPR